MPTLRAALLLPILLSALPALAQADPPARPSFVLIVTDDQRWDTLDAIHSVDGATPVMPSVSALADEGLLFTNAFVTTSLCGPSRAALLTGQYGQTRLERTGANPWDGALTFDHSATIAAWLDDAGYRTGLYGFYLFEYGQLWPGIPAGWDEWHVVQSGKAYDFNLLENGIGFDHTNTYYGSGCFSYSKCPGDLGGCENPANHQTEVLRDKVLDFLDAQPPDEPFFVMLTLAAPHMPACPVPQDAGSFAGLDPWRPPNYDEPDPLSKPAWSREFCPVGPAGRARMDADRERQLETLQGVDRAVAAIVDKLDAVGRTDDTVVIFTSDNGFRWGEHCLWSKPCPHEECNRVPLVIRYPNGIPQPGVESWPVALIDLAPTLVEMAGGSMTIQPDGRSLAPLLAGGPKPWPPELLHEWWRRPLQEDQTWIPPNHVALRNVSFKLVQYDTGERELYNLLADPFELVNLAGDPAHAGIEAGMRARITASGHVFGCADGIDTDGDGLTDLDDPGCDDADDLAETSPRLPCDDGLDNDGDGFYDSADRGCANPESPMENPACADGRDNDNDGFIDADGGASLNGGVPRTAPDPECNWQLSGRAEQVTRCGLGAELVLLAPLLGRLRRRRCSSGV